MSKSMSNLSTSPNHTCGKDHQSAVGLLRLLQACPPSLAGADSSLGSTRTRLDTAEAGAMRGTETDWLIARGYALPAKSLQCAQQVKNHSCQTTEAGRPPDRSLLLTPAGAALGRYLTGCLSVLRRLSPDAELFGRDPGTLVLSALGLCPELTPHWENRTSDLWAGPVLVKSFSRCAPNQMALLDAFQDRHWPRRIADPLRCDRDEVDPKQRLHDTIKDLNRTLILRVLRFRGDGTGQGALWEWVPPADAPGGDRKRRRLQRKRF